MFMDTQTEFSRWLESQGLTPNRFAAQHKFSEIMVYQLARPGCYPSRPIALLPLDSLGRISEITGIPAGLMVDELLAGAAGE